MRQPIIECVPNFSEGRDTAVIEKIVDAIRHVEGVELLDIKPGRADHRTVVTFIGPPESVLEGAFQGIAMAQKQIDMRNHSGEHPRMGATDVCPFVPVKDATLEECADLARRLAKRVGEELSIPVFLYEAAARTPERKRLPDLRRGEYEALQNKLSDPNWGPDFGPTDFSEEVAKSGGTVIGARPFLIAWNINLNTLNQRKAEKIASRIREKGFNTRDENGQLVMGADGKPIKTPGYFKEVNAIGWTIEEYGRCQISINMTDYRVTPLHAVYDAIGKMAVDEGVIVTGSELVGLIPGEALLEAGRHYLSLAGENPGRPERDVIEFASMSLGLNDLGPFDADQSIIERRIFADGPLIKDSVRGFVDMLSSSAPAPGGGSTAALCGALSAALSAMVAQLSTKITKKSWPYGQQRPRDWARFDEMTIKAQTLKEDFLRDVDADTAAFDAIMAASRMPKHTEDDRKRRVKAMRKAIIDAIEAPLRSLNRCLIALDCANLALEGNPNARSDAGVAISCARACAEGAWMNVRINLSSLRNPDERRSYADKADKALESIQKRSVELLQGVFAELKSEN